MIVSSQLTFIFQHLNKIAQIFYYNWKRRKPEEKTFFGIQNLSQTISEIYISQNRSSQEIIVSNIIFRSSRVLRGIVIEYNKKIQQKEIKWEILLFFYNKLEFQSYVLVCNSCQCFENMIEFIFESRFFYLFFWWLFSSICERISLRMSKIRVIQFKHVFIVLIPTHQFIGLDCRL